MPLLSLQPPYVPLIQKPCCCAVTCLQMILYRNGCGLFDQEELAIKFGVKIAAQDTAAFSLAMPIMTRANLDEGIQTVESEHTINAFFSEQSLPLRATSYKQSSLRSVPAFLQQHLEENHDVWTEYHTNEIYSAFPSEADAVHDGLIERYDPESLRLTLIDPMPNHPQRVTITPDVLDRSISDRYGRETGFIVIEKN